jgi:hypothetical protein
LCSEENRRFVVKRDSRRRRRSRVVFGKNTLLELLVLSVFVVFLRTCGYGRDCYWSSSQDYERGGLASSCIGAASSSGLLY